MKRMFLLTSLVLTVTLLVVASLWAFALAAGDAAQAAPLFKFTDDFESGADKWTPLENTSVGIAADGANHVYTMTNYPGSTARSIVSNTEAFGWTDYKITARVQLVTGTASDTAVVLLGRFQDARNYYFMTVRANGQVQIRRYYNGSSSGRTLGSASDLITVGTWYTAEFELYGNTLRALIDGTPVITATDTSDEAFSAGTVGLSVIRAQGLFDDVVVTNGMPLNVTKSGDGDGTVTSIPEGIDCGVTCTADFVVGSIVTLTAQPAATSTIGTWDCPAPGTLIAPYTCLVRMDQPQSVGVTFEAATITYYTYLPVVNKNN
ncbi:MAG: hypothetical protein JW850_16460 [Thermoflexales bacterium]|nr:hypothetical protein [Thermoflexales bacterium]